MPRRISASSAGRAAARVRADVERRLADVQPRRVHADLDRRVAAHCARGARGCRRSPPACPSPARPAAASRRRARRRAAAPAWSSRRPRSAGAAAAPAAAAGRRRARVQVGAVVLRELVGERGGDQRRSPRRAACRGGAKSTPRVGELASRWPAPTPRMTRPPESASSVANAFAVTSGWR